MRVPSGKIIDPVALGEPVLALLHDLRHGGVPGLAVDRDGVHLPHAQPDHRYPQQLALEHPHLAGEHHHHRHGFPGGGMLPQRDVLARRQRLALDAVVEPAAPLQHPAARCRRRAAPARSGAGTAARRTRSTNGIAKTKVHRNRKQREEQRRQELHAPVHAPAALGACRRSAQPGSRDRSATSAEQSAAAARADARRLARSCGFSSMTITCIEEGVDHRAQLREPAQRGGVLALARSLRRPRPAARASHRSRRTSASSRR